ncbi:MAG: hypothetical protein ACT4ON_03400 [Bacteroidota bacterium]
MKTFLYILMLMIISISANSQTDSIFTNSGKIVLGTITLVNDNNIFYTDKKGNGNHIDLVNVNHYIKSGKSNIPYQKELNSVKRDSIKTEIAIRKSETKNKSSDINSASFVIAGVSFIAGSVLSFIANNKSVPLSNNYSNTTAYQKAVDDHATTVKNYKNISSIFYGLGGVCMIIGVAFNF